eukprot:6416153-Karenia_brevis.AAC.1
MCHFPHNPYCKGCREGNIQQRRYARTGEKEDDGLPAVEAINQMYTSDILVCFKNAEESDSPAGDTTTHTVRDVHSGLLLGFPGRQRKAKD